MKLSEVKVAHSCPTKATVSYLEELAKTTNEGGYTEQQIFKVG